METSRWKDLSELGQVPACLPHDPYRRPLDIFPPSGPEQEVVGERGERVRCGPVFRAGTGGRFGGRVFQRRHGVGLLVLSVVCSACWDGVGIVELGVEAEQTTIGQNSRTKLGPRKLCPARDRPPSGSRLGYERAVQLHGQRTTVGASHPYDQLGRTRRPIARQPATPGPAKSLRPGPTNATRRAPTNDASATVDRTP